MTALLALEVSENYFTLMRQPIIYPHATVSASASKKLGLNWRYLSEELVGLTLFDSKQSNYSKRLIIAAMNEEALDHPFN